MLHRKNIDFQRMQNTPITFKLVFNKALPKHRDRTKKSTGLVAGALEWCCTILLRAVRQLPRQIFLRCQMRP